MTASTGSWCVSWGSWMLPLTPCVHEPGFLTADDFYFKKTVLDRGEPGYFLERHMLANMQEILTSPAPYLTAALCNSQVNRPLPCLPACLPSLVCAFVNVHAHTLANLGVPTPPRCTYITYLCIHLCMLRLPTPGDSNATFLYIPAGFCNTSDG